MEPLNGWTPNRSLEPGLDSNGEPISGALLHTYSAGTTTNKVTYQDAGLTTPHANPVVADSAGRFPEIWAQDAATFDLKWTDAAGVPIKLFEDVQSLGTTETGAITRDFGADGRLNIESRSGVTHIEGGDPAPDNTGGQLRIGGWSETQADSIELDADQTTSTGDFAAQIIDAQLQLKGKGTASDDSAAGGYIGEEVSSEVASSSAVSLTSGVAKSVTSISLTAGHWELTGNVFASASGGGATFLRANWSLSSDTSELPPGHGNVFTNPGLTGTASGSATLTPDSLKLSATTTVYLVTTAIFTGTVNAYGKIRALRVR